MAAFLTDGTVSLRPVEREDLAQLRDWRNDADLRMRTREFRALNMENQDAWFRRISSPDTQDFMFVVLKAVEVMTSTGSTAYLDLDLQDIEDRLQLAAPKDFTIGVVGLCAWSPPHRTAEVSFYIGDPMYRGHGYATKALQLLQDWGFQELGLDRIWAESYATNEGGIKTLEKLGYKREGVLRKHVFRNGERVDSIMWGLLKEEWNAAK